MFYSPSDADILAGFAELGLDQQSMASMLAATNESFRSSDPVPKSSAAFHFALNAGAAGRRPNAQRIQMLHRNLQGLNDLCPANMGDQTACFVRANVFKAEADRQWQQNKYSDACAMYIRAASEMVAAPLPSGGDIHSSMYNRLGHGWDAVDLTACINGIIECSRQLEDLNSALQWLEEADILDKNVVLSVDRLSPSFEWKRTQISSPDYYFERITTLRLAAEIFLSAGNTGSAVHRRWLADDIFAALPAKLRLAQTVKLTPLLGSDILRLQHPDPNTTQRATVEHPDLQMRGSWKKLSIPRGAAPAPRTRPAICAFGGQLYVLGGEKDIDGPWFRDFWVLDLATLDGWRKLPDFPFPKEVSDNLVAYQLAMHRDGRAFVFTGIPTLAVFDTRRGKWSTMRTTFVPDNETPDWPYPACRVMEYSAHCVGDRLYIFGGVHQPSIVGTDLLMELHLPSRKWRRLSGSTVPLPSVGSPGPRGHCCSWVGKDGGRIYYMFGEADRFAAMIHKQAHGGPYSHAYGDLWSWDIKAAKWTQERLRGNVPSPRSEMACTYNAALEKVIVFGGYNPAVPTWFEDKNDIVTYTYYADTFIGDVASASSSTASPSSPDPAPTCIPWKQVLTRGFPTYRAEGTLVTDSKTGKTYLFGGYKNTVYVRSKNPGSSGSRSFMDLWQLRLDLPGGYFAGVDLEEEARTAKAGPWQRCFACGSTGPWKKCGGTCNGRAYFCDSECLKEGWKEHKEKHACGKA